MAKDSQDRPGKRARIPDGDYHAGLLWHLLGTDARQKIARHLSLDELERMRYAFRQYRKSDSARRRLIEDDVRRRIGARRSSLPAVASLLLFVGSVALFIGHMMVRPELILEVRAAVFNPLALAVVAPLTLYLIPPYRLRMLFRVLIPMEALGVTFVATLGLTWVLAYIGFEQLSTEGGNPNWWDEYSIAVYLAGAILAPLFEEVIFRELLPSMMGSAPFYFGHLASAILFALAHLPSSAYMFGLILMGGLFLSVVRIQSETLLYPFLAHAISNATAFLMDVI